MNFLKRFTKKLRRNIALLMILVLASAFSVSASEGEVSRLTSDKKLILVGDTSEDDAGKDNASEDTTSEDTTSEENSSEEITPEDASSEIGTSEVVTSEQQTSEQNTSEQPTTEQITTEQVTRNTDLFYTELSPADAKVLVIDPGHCNKHPGAHGNGLKEEVVVLDISLAMYEALKDYGDITVYMTREDGGCCKNLGVGSDCLYARSNYAQLLSADFLVSVHINAGRSSGANALAAYNSGYHDRIRVETQAFGRVALKELKKLGIANRGFLLRKSGSGSRYPNGKLCDYYAIVRRGVVDEIPGVIMEHGYITSASDCKKFFSTKAKRKKVGEADANAIITYYHLSKKTVEGSFIAEGGKTYYKNTAGQKVAGWVKSDGLWYYFDEMTGEMKKGFITLNDNTFYLSPGTGEMVVGSFIVDGSEYMTRGNGTLVRSSVYTDGVGTYLYDIGGRKLNKGFHTIDNNTYYVVSSKKVAKGITKIGSKYYGFDSKTGCMLYGEQKIGSKYYYLDPETGIAAKNTIITVGEEKYYYGTKATRQTGFVKYKGAKYYFAKSSGEMVTGWKKIKGKYYYFDEETGKMAKSKWIGNYYVNKKGVRTKKK